jgi:hypothetical protein
MLRWRVRYFTDGAVIGSGEFVNEAFAAARERFPAKRKDGARRVRGRGASERDAPNTACGETPQLRGGAAVPLDQVGVNQAFSAE